MSECGQKLFKVIKRLVWIFQEFVVQHKAFDDEFPELLHGPDAEAGCHMTFHPIADRDDHIEVVVCEGTLNQPIALLTN